MKWDTIVREFERRIQDGRYRPGDRLPTVRELVREFDASSVTICRALRQLVAAGKLQTRRGDGIRVNQSLRVEVNLTRRAGRDLIGALLPASGELIPGRGHYWFNIMEVLQSAANECERRRCKLVNHYIVMTEGVTERLVALCRERSYLGFIMPSGLDPSVIMTVLEHHRPLVQVPSNNCETPDMVNDSHRQGCLTACAHLAQRGRRRLLFAGQGQGVNEAEKKLAIDEGRRLHNWPNGNAMNVFAKDIETTAGERIMALRRRKIRFDAVFAVNDYTAANILETFARQGVHVPDHVAVIGCDDMPGAAQLSPPLATVNRERHQMGKELVRLLFSRIQEPEAPLRRLVVVNRFIARASAG